MQLLVIKNPKQSMKFCREIFFSILELKLDAFSDQFGEFYISLDKFDFVSDYYYVVDEVDGKLIPVMGFQFLKSETIEHYGLENPFRHWIETNQSLMHALDQLKRDFGIVCGLILNPKYAKNTKNAILYRSMMYSMVLKAFESRTVFSAAATRNFAHKTNEKIGFKPLCSTLCCPRINDTLSGVI